MIECLLVSASMVVALWCSLVMCHLALGSDIVDSMISAYKIMTMQDDWEPWH